MLPKTLNTIDVNLLQITGDNDEKYHILSDINTFNIIDISKDGIEISDSEIIRKYDLETVTETLTKEFIVKATTEFIEEFSEYDRDAIKYKISLAFNGKINSPIPPNEYIDPNHTYDIHHQLEQFQIMINGKIQEFTYIAAHDIDNKLRLVYVYFKRDGILNVILTNCGAHEFIHFHYGYGQVTKVDNKYGPTPDGQIKAESNFDDYIGETKFYSNLYYFIKRNQRKQKFYNYLLNKSINLIEDKLDDVFSEKDNIKAKELRNIIENTIYDVVMDNQILFSNFRSLENVNESLEQDVFNEIKKNLIENYD